MRSDTSLGRMRRSQPAYGAVIRISHAINRPIAHYLIGNANVVALCVGDLGKLWMTVTRLITP
jgi:hypothetical protein